MAKAETPAAQKPEQDPKPPAKVVGDADVDSGKPPKPQAAAAKHPLQVAPGKAVAHARARKGHLTQGDEVRENDFDPQTLRLLIRKGIVLDNRRK